MENKNPMTDTTQRVLNLSEYADKCRPCIREAIKNQILSDNGYLLRVAIAELKSIGAPDEVISEYLESIGELENRDFWDYNTSKPYACLEIQRYCGEIVFCETCSYDKLTIKPKTQAGVLINYVEDDGIVLFHDQYGKPYAKIDNRIISTRDRNFKRWLAQKYFKEFEKTINTEAFNSALNVIEAKAVFDGRQYTLHNRVCWHDGAIWYDLADGRAVKITQNGWEIIDNPPILFRRYTHQRLVKLTEPFNGNKKDVERILKYVNIKEKDDQILFLVTLISYFIPDIPHPCFILHGDKGAAKTTTLKVCKEIVDPSVVRILSFPKDHTELVQQLDHHYYVPYDNISSLSEWQSDTLCRAITGEGFTKRELYTNDSDVIYAFQRCIGLNGVNVVANKPDLLDRSILIQLNRIPTTERKPEQNLWAEFERDKEAIIKGIFSVLSEAVAIKPNIKLSRYFRMADYTVWGCAIAEALGHSKEVFLNAYYGNIQTQNKKVIEGNVVGLLILKLMEMEEEWTGTPTELLQKLTDIAEEQGINTNTRGFPKVAHVLTRRLNELKTNLLEVGIEYQTWHSTYRYIGLKRVGKIASYASERPNQQQETEKSKDGIRTLKDTHEIASEIASDEKQKQERASDASDGSDAFSLNSLGLSSTPDNQSECTNLYNNVQSSFQTFGNHHQGLKRIASSIEKAGKEFTKLYGPINSSNLIKFCMWYCEQYNNESNPSEIKEIAKRIFKITPEQEGKKKEEIIITHEDYKHVKNGIEEFERVKGKKLCEENITEFALWFAGNNTQIEPSKVGEIAKLFCEDFKKLVKVRFLVDVPQFAGGDSENKRTVTYGSFEAGYVDKIPLLNAKSLIERKGVEIIIDIEGGI